MSAPRIVIAAGGTAGHVVPAIAVADALRAEGAEVSFVGGERAEAELVPAAGYALDPIRVEGISRTNPLKAARARRSRRRGAVGARAAILRRREADAVLGGGGYVAGPVGLAAVLAPDPARADRGRLAPRADQPAAGRAAPAASASPSRCRAATASATSSPAAPCRRATADREDGPRRPRPRRRGAAACSSSAARSAPARSTRRRSRPSPTRPTACSTSPAGATSPTLDRARARTTTCATTSTPFGTALAAADLAVARSGGSIFELAQYGAARGADPVPARHAPTTRPPTPRWMERRRRRDRARRRASSRRSACARRSTRSCSTPTGWPRWAPPRPALARPDAARRRRARGPGRDRLSGGGGLAESGSPLRPVSGGAALLRPARAAPARPPRRARASCSPRRRRARRARRRRSAARRPRPTRRARPARRPGTGTSSAARFGAAGLAVVAVPARRLERLAEVGEDEAAPAVVGLGVGAHHVHARAVERAPVALGLGRRLDRLLAAGPVVAAARPRRRAAPRPRPPPRAARRAVASLVWLELGRLLQRAPARPGRPRRCTASRPCASSATLDLPAAGEEAPQAEVLGAVEEHALGRLAVAARRARPPGSRRRATRRSRRGRPSARSACRRPCRTRWWRRRRRARRP